MPERKSVTFTMDEEDIRFLCFAMDFLVGGIEDETRRGFWETTFRRTAEDEFDVEYTPHRDRKKGSK
jgi:hypothetical protein